jgi:hypothetical protein
MIIDVLIQVEGFGNIQCVSKIYFPRNGSFVLEKRQQVCGAENGVDVHNGHDSVPNLVVVQFKDP